MYRKLENLRVQNSNSVEKYVYSQEFHFNFAHYRPSSAILNGSHWFFPKETTRILRRRLQAGISRIKGWEIFELISLKIPPSPRVRRGRDLNRVNVTPSLPGHLHVKAQTFSLNFVYRKWKSFRSNSSKIDPFLWGQSAAPVPRRPAAILNLHYWSNTLHDTGYPRSFNLTREPGIMGKIRAGR